MKCPYCGGDNRNDNEYCEYCGSYIKKEEQQPQTVVHQNIYVNNNIHNNPQRQQQQPLPYNAAPTNYSVPKKRWALKPKTSVILIIVAVVLVVATISGISRGVIDGSSSVWLAGYTDINDFNYYIDGDSIYIKRYENDNAKIRINTSYNIDGKTKKVTSLNEGTFFCKRTIKSIIIPEGIKTLDDNTFNSCGVKYLFLPSTLQAPNDVFWGYFHSVEKIYYGGTEEQWKKLCKVERSELDVKEIVYNAKPDSLE